MLARSLFLYESRLDVRFELRIKGRTVCDVLQE